MTHREPAAKDNLLIPSTIHGASAGGPPAPCTRRPLGSTGLLVSPIGFGAFKIGRNREDQVSGRVRIAERRRTSTGCLNGLLDLGINYIDTAPAYGVSEERIGRVLRHRRSEFVLATKVGETFADGVSHYDFSANRRSRERRAQPEPLADRRARRALAPFRRPRSVDPKRDRRRRRLAGTQATRPCADDRTVGQNGRRGAAQALDWADVLDGRIPHRGPFPRKADPPRRPHAASASSSRRDSPRAICPRTGRSVSCWRIRTSLPSSWEG